MYQSYKIIKVSTIRDSNYGYVDPFGSENMVNPPVPLRGWRIWSTPPIGVENLVAPPRFAICVALHIFTERSQLSPDRNVKKLNEILRKK